MSDWSEECGIVVIKEQYDIDFGYLFSGEYNKIQNKQLYEKIEKYLDDKSFIPLKEWIVFDYIPNSSIYKMKYKYGIFTFGVSWNKRGRNCAFFLMFFEEIMPMIVDTTIRHEWWDENDSGNKPLSGKNSYCEGWKY